MPPCPICSENNWKKLRGSWKRCLRCGHLDTTLTQRKCIICNEILGKYSKRTMQVCFRCQGKKRHTKSEQKKCITPHCPNAIKDRKHGNYCQQCQTELYDTKTKNGNLWKQKAYNLLEKMYHIETLHKKLKREYPKLTRQKIINFLKKHTDLGNVQMVEPGVYIRKIDTA